MWVADDLLLDAVSPVFVEISHLEAQCRCGDAVNLRPHMPALVMKERLAVGYQVLQVAHLRCVDRGVIHFSDNTVGDGEPNAARDGVGCSDAVFGAARPSRWNARTTRCRVG